MTNDWADQCVPWVERFPPEERESFPVIEKMLGRVLAQSSADLTNDGACIYALMCYGIRCREATDHLRAAQRHAIVMRTTGRAA